METDIKNLKEKVMIDKKIVEALYAASEALEAISDEMTVGERYTNAGQYLIDSLPVVRDAIECLENNKEADLRDSFEKWAQDTNQGYDLTEVHSGKLSSYECDKTEHAWRGFYHGRRAIAPVTKPSPSSEDFAHEVWAAAQSPHGEPVEKSVARVASLLAEFSAPVADERVRAEALYLLREARALLPRFTTAEAIGDWSYKVERFAEDHLIDGSASAPVAGEAVAEVQIDPHSPPDDERTIIVPLVDFEAVDAGTKLYAAPQASEVDRGVICIYENREDFHRNASTNELAAWQMGWNDCSEDRNAKDREFVFEGYIPVQKWVVDYANKISTYMEENCFGHWELGGIQKREMRNDNR